MTSFSFMCARKCNDIKQFKFPLCCVCSTAAFTGILQNFWKSSSARAGIYIWSEEKFNVGQLHILDISLIITRSFQVQSKESGRAQQLENSKGSCNYKKIMLQDVHIGIKVWNLKIDFNTEGTWRPIKQWTLMMMIYNYYMIWLCRFVAKRVQSCNLREDGRFFQLWTCFATKQQSEIINHKLSLSLLTYCLNRRQLPPVVKSIFKFRTLIPIVTANVIFFLFRLYFIKRNILGIVGLYLLVVYLVNIFNCIFLYYSYST